MADLSAGDLDPADALTTNLGLQEHAHRVGLQRTAFRGAMAIATVLLATAMALSGSAVYLYGHRDRFDWHVALLVAAFIVPATVITVALLRAAFPKSAPDETTVPALQATRDLVEVLVKGKG